ncbi:MAG: hypothetical protein VX529_08070 [Pseudomonadota bacterium]|nr:hypothetical protein [Pseudomonadota bacterium]
MKAKPPQEDPETKARREQAERLAEDRQIGETQRDVSRQTDELIRRFGNRLAMSGLGVGGGFFSGGGSPGGSGSGGSGNPAPTGGTRTGGYGGGITGGGIGGSGLQIF